MEEGQGINILVFFLILSFLINLALFFLFFFLFLLSKPFNEQKKEEKKVKRQKAALANMKAETTNALRALEELYLTITLIREVIRPLLPADSPDAQLTVALLALNIGD